MAFKYLEFWNEGDQAKTQDQNKAFKESVKGEVFEKPLLRSGVLIVDSKNHSIQESRQRPNDLNNFFIKRERATLRELKRN